MKKTYTVLAAMALAGSAQATDVTPTPNTTITPVAICFGASAAEKHTIAGGPGTPYTTADSFLKTGFAVQCSANTHVAFANVSATQFLVGAGSTKGNQSVRGSSNGGAVVTHTKCTTTNDACSSGDVTAATAAASSM